jgi:hypothetical protein
MAPRNWRQKKLRNWLIDADHGELNIYTKSIEDNKKEDMGGYQPSIAARASAVASRTLDGPYFKSNMSSARCATLAPLPYRRLH